MKKTIIILISIIIGLEINANPIALPTIEISELQFENSGEWILELGFYEVNQNGLSIDSIFLYSTEDTVKLPSYTFSDSTGVFVITNDSLSSDFNINRYGDTIKVVYYVEGYSVEDVLIFGNIEGAVINCPRLAQSICKYWMCYVKDNSPSIGFINDTLGMCGTVRGTIYDKFSVPVTNREFHMNYKFETSENGGYSTRVYSKPSAYNQLSYIAGQYSTESVAISEISFIMEPDSVIERDIYLLDTLANGLTEINMANVPVKIYPNPVSTSEKLMVEIDLPIKTSEIRVELVSLDGKLIKTMKVTEMLSKIELSEEKGLYILSIWLDNQLLSSNRIFVRSE